MTSTKFHTDEASVPRSGLLVLLIRLGIVGNVLQSIIFSTLTWIVTRHQYGFSVLVSETSFHRETSGGVTKCQLYSQATKEIT